MQVAFLLTRDELRRVRRLFYRHLQSRSERLIDYTLLAMPVVVVVASLLLIYRGTLRRWEELPWALFGVFTVMAGDRWRRHHQFADQPDYSEKQTLEVGEDGIFRLTRPGQKVSLPWTKISKYAETPDMFLLMCPWPWGIETKSWWSAWQTKPVLIIVPKRALCPGEDGQFRAFLTRKLSIWAKERSLAAVPQHSQL